MSVVVGRHQRFVVAVAAGSLLVGCSERGPADADVGDVDAGVGEVDAGVGGADIRIYRVAEPLTR